MTPLAIAAQRMSEHSKQMQNNKSPKIPAQPQLIKTASAQKSQDKKEAAEPVNDWRISIISHKAEENKMMTDRDSMGGDPLALSPDNRMRRFVGKQDDLMISAIKQDRIGLPGQESDGDFDAVIEESGFVDREDLNNLNSSPFFEADDL